MGFHSVGPLEGPTAASSELFFRILQRVTGSVGGTRKGAGLFIIEDKTRARGRVGRYKPGVGV